MTTVIGQRRPRRDDGRGMDLGHPRLVYSSRIIAANTASAIKLSPTLARPSNFQTLPRLALLGDMDIEPVAGEHRAAEPRIVDAHEIDELALRFRPERMHDQHRRGLRHRLDDQHARHHRPRREMALKIILVDRHVLDAGRPLVRHHVDDLVDHQERMAMRDHLHDPLDIDLRALLRRAQVGSIITRPSFPGEPLQHGGLPHELGQRHRRAAAHRLSGRHVAHDTALGGDPRAAADMQMAGKPALPADHDKIAEPRAAGDADLTGQDAAPPEHHIVPDLHQIINHRARRRSRYRDPSRGRSWCWRRYRHRRR